MKTYTYEEVTAILRTIAHAPDSQTKVLGMRRKSRKEWAQAVRSLLKEVGITGVSVTAPNYSMASSITIRLPYYDYGRHECQTSADKWDINASVECRQCNRKRAAQKRLNELILSAFPDLNDRSEYQSDYFDFCFTIE